MVVWKEIEVMGHYLYLITNKINGKQYVGITVRSVQERFKEHCNTTQSLLSKAIIKHGASNFTVETLRDCIDYDTLREDEVKEILKRQTISPLGYNIVAFNPDTFVSMSASDYRETLSKASKGKRKTSSHALNISKSRLNLKIKHSEETKAKLAAISTGKKLSEESRRKQSESMRLWHSQNKRSPETLEKMGRARRGATHTQEVKDHLSSLYKGKPNKNTRLTNLTFQDKDCILEKLSKKQTMKSIAEEYSVSYDTIKEIKYGRHWLCKEDTRNDRTEKS